MKKTAIAIAGSILVAGCISTDMGNGSKIAAPDAGVNHERGTGSNISRKDRDVNVSVGGREELENLQRAGGGNQKSGK